MRYNYQYMIRGGVTTLSVFPQRSIHPVWQATYPSYTRVGSTDDFKRDKTLVEHGAMTCVNDAGGLASHLINIGILQPGDTLNKH